MDPISVFGAVAGSAGLLGAAWTILWNIYQERRNRPILKVKAQWGMAYWGLETLECLIVEVANVGKRPITISNCFLETIDSKGCYFVPGASWVHGLVGFIVDQSFKMPKRLHEGESHSFLFPVAAIRQWVRENPARTICAAAVQDAIGGIWRCQLGNDLSSYLMPETSRQG